MSAVGPKQELETLLTLQAHLATQPNLDNMLIYSTKSGKIDCEAKGGICGRIKRLFMAIFNFFSGYRPYDATMNFKQLGLMFSHVQDAISKNSLTNVTNNDLSALATLAKNLDKIRLHILCKTHNQTVKQTLSALSLQARPANLEQFEDSPVYNLLGSTSDHSWKSYRFQASGLDVKVGTWNLMDRCKCGNDLVPANNPLNTSETNSQYLVRKKAQFQEIKKLIQGGVANLDALSFQEVDFWLIGETAELKQTPHDWELPYLAAYREFKQMLAECGWKLISSDPKKKKNEQDPLIMIYDPKRLQPKAALLSPCFTQKRHGGNIQVRGAEALFTDLATGKDLCLANLHLDFSIIPQTAVEKYQKDKVSRNIPTLAVGDLNRPPNLDMSSAIIDWNYPTNVDAEDRTNPATLTLTDPRKNFTKAYDAAFANPGSGQDVAIITETEMTFFKKRSIGPGVELEFKNLQQRHESLPGTPWKRRRHLNVPE